MTHINMFPRRAIMLYPHWTEPLPFQEIGLGWWLLRAQDIFREKLR